jgi:uncharacterized protein
MSIGAPSASSILPSGMPCWVELATTDETAAQDFYGRLFGWTYRVNRDPATRNGWYLIASLGTVDVGGLYRAAPGQSSTWTINLAVHSTANAATWVKHLGGRVALGPVHLPHRGSILHAMDPSGALVVLWQAPESWDFASGIPGTFSGAELATRDGIAADRFFCRLFNYTPVRIGQREDYVEWRLDQQPVLYRYEMGREYPPQTPSHWMVYFEIDPARGTDTTAARAVTFGGTLLVEPHDSPWGRTAVLLDPTGARFSIVDRSVIGDDWGRAEVDDPYDD